MSVGIGPSERRTDRHSLDFGRFDLGPDPLEQGPTDTVLDPGRLRMALRIFGRYSNACEHHWLLRISEACVMGLASGHHLPCKSLNIWLFF